MSSIKRLMIVAGLLAVGVSAANAEPRYNPRKMTCEAVQDVIRAHGAVTLRYNSTRVKNLPLYNRYVRNSYFCDTNETAVPASVPTADRDRCPVKVCEQRDFERDRRIPWLLDR
ncbi:hypothetical protein [Gellertiella hungarica]|uniref:Uncharacterized protein n=1 Tax=Gellertiella hungarica TaxID=1572859 RepID=A0A7W6NMM5_9HYPH|nr:hypothetical protein [Gellertiella hungarica]MBB4067133.1 hypothetical protein [Gellertiella hungarica]